MTEEVKVIHLEGEPEAAVLVFRPGCLELFGRKIFKRHGDVGIKVIPGQHIAECELFTQEAHELTMCFHDGGASFHIDIQYFLFFMRIGAETVQGHFEGRKGGCKVCELTGDCFFQQGICRKGHLQGNVRHYFYGMAGAILFCKFLFKADDLFTSFRGGQQCDKVDLVLPFGRLRLAEFLFRSGVGPVSLVKSAAALVVAVIAPVVAFPVPIVLATVTATISGWPVIARFETTGLISSINVHDKVINDGFNTYN